MTSILLAGLFIGAVYGLLGVGLVVAYRGSRVINFAYAETGMIAAFVYSDLRFGRGPIEEATDHGLWPALPVALLVAAGLGAATELLIVRPLRDAARIRPLVATLALGALLLAFAVRFWGPDVRYVAPLISGSGVDVAGITVTPQQLLILVTSAGIVLLLGLVYRWTSFGLRLRAVALDPYGAGLLGVNVNRTSAMVWALAGLIAGLSGILIAPVVAFNVFFMTALLIRGLGAALLGGLTSITGTFVAGVGIGLAEAVIGYLTPVSGVTDVALAVFLILAISVRPQGLTRVAY